MVVSRTDESEVYTINEERIAALEQRIAELERKLIAAQSGVGTFERVDVKRINMVDEDGTVRMIIHSGDGEPTRLERSSTAPPTTGANVESTQKAGSSTGMFFFNASGREVGGVHAGRTLAFSVDQHLSDQVIKLHSWETEQGEIQRRGLIFWDRPPGSDRDYREKFVEENGREPRVAELEFQRLFLGRIGRDARLSFGDRSGRERLRLIVDDDGNARIEFLDEKGEVKHVFPPDAHGMLRFPSHQEVPEVDNQTVLGFLGKMGYDVDFALSAVEEGRGSADDTVIDAWRDWLQEVKRMNGDR